jgi:uncharacterized membrane protein YjgN (DUF898 family)
MLDVHGPAQPAGDFAHASEPAITRHRPEFSGRAGEYFGIWFVNLLLSIVTLGIYSAWAKVRTERYFYGNTRLAGASFDYLANPIAILKGRLIAYAVLIALFLSLRFSMGLYFTLFMAIWLLMPMIIVLGLRFRARNSAWRGLAFKFDEPAGNGYGPFLGWPILSSFTLSLMYPGMMRRQHEFVVEGHRFGGERFDFRGETGTYYKPYLLALLFGVLLIVGFVSALAGVVAAGPSDGSDAPASAALGGGAMAVMAMFYAGFFALMVMLQVRYRNLLWNNTRLGEHRFESNLRVRDMMWIYASNVVAIVCTLGLATPWAMVRLARYRAEPFAVVTRGGIESFVAEANEQRSAVGQEIVDAMDVGVDLGI